MWNAVYRCIFSTIVVGIPNMPSKNRRNRINSVDRHDKEFLMQMMRMYFIHPSWKNHKVFSNNQSLLG